MLDLASPLKIDTITVRNRVFLAPMSGVSDLPFRHLAWQAGAGMVISEMIASAELCRGRMESQLRLKGENLGLHVVQLAGRDPSWLQEAVLIAQDNGVDMIDINMGCPAKKVIGGYAGAALLKDLPLACKLIEAAVNVAHIPISIKIRLGWDEKNIVAPKLAKEAQDLGVKMISVHARTREQFYGGKARWDLVKTVRECIHIPLVINGDIATREDAFRALELSNADALMIGRASYGMPWLPGQLAYGTNVENILTYIKNHYQAMLTHYGEGVGVRHARKHLGWYMKKHARSFDVEKYRALMREDKSERVLTLLDEIFE